MPTSRRRVVTHRKTRPPVAHWSSTVAASSRITRRVSHRVSDPPRHGKDSSSTQGRRRDGRNTTQGPVLSTREERSGYERRVGDSGLLLLDGGHDAPDHPAVLAEA